MYKNTFDNMKNLNLYIKESLLDDEDVLMNDTSEKVIEENVNNFLKDNYRGVYKISKKPINGKYIVDSNGDLEVKNKNITSLTNECFKFGSIGRDFACSGCKSLTSLEGAPEKVGGDFDCWKCNSLTSPEGAPEKISGDFDCCKCNSLISLKGGPKKVDGSFNCYNCKSLTSLEGAPKKVGGNFSCYIWISLKSLKGSPEKVGWNFACPGCNLLTSLEGGPKEVDGKFKCYNCKTEFSEEDVKNVSNVKGIIVN